MKMNGMRESANTGKHKEKHIANLRYTHWFAEREVAMKRHKEDQFLRWAKSKRIVLDPKYPEYPVLSFDPPAG